MREAQVSGSLLDLLVDLDHDFDRFFKSYRVDHSIFEGSIVQRILFNPSSKLPEGKETDTD